MRVAIGHAVVYHAWVAYTFKIAGIKYLHCTLFVSETVDLSVSRFGLVVSRVSLDGSGGGGEAQLDMQLSVRVDASDWPANANNKQMFDYGLYLSGENSTDYLRDGYL